MPYSMHDKHHLVLAISMGAYPLCRHAVSLSHLCKKKSEQYYLCTAGELE